MASSGKRQINRRELREMFSPVTGISTGMGVDEALGTVLDLARDAVMESEVEHNEIQEALGVVERLRFFIETNGDEENG